MIESSCDIEIIFLIFSKFSRSDVKNQPIKE